MIIQLFTIRIQLVMDCKTLVSFVYCRYDCLITGALTDSCGSRSSSITHMPARPTMCSTRLVPRTAVRSSWKRRQFLHTLLLSLIHLVQLCLGYMAMLLVMSYNFWFIFCVIVGCVVGFLLFRVFLLYKSARALSDGDTRSLCTHHHLISLRNHQCLTADSCD